MSATERRRGPGLDAETIILFAVLGIILWAGISLEVGMRLGYAADGTGAVIPGNPFALLILVVRGALPFTTAAIIDSAGVALGSAILAVILVLMFRRRGHRGAHDVDVAARHMATGHELDRLRQPHVAAEAKRLGVQGGVIGLPIGRTVHGHDDLVADWEADEVDIWGKRTGKSVSRAIPCILAAPGAVLTTENKRTNLDATRDPRAVVGRVFVFDPQRIADEPPTFYWDPLSYIMSGPAGSEVKAQQLAAIFAAAVTSPEARTDKFFDPKGTALLGHLLHAAALDRRPITDVYGWVTRETDAEPARILDREGFGLSAEAVRGVIGSPDKQRGGVYGTAEGFVSFLTNRSAVEWITEQIGRPAFDPYGFAMSRDTLYLLSREGRGTLGALTTSLTAAVCEAAETVAMRSSLGRLPTPMVAVLDEVANVCRWPDLPDLYSHFGGRGIYLMSILQSWSQGVGVWGREGMTKLWSAASIRIYGGGASEGEFLRELAALVGHYRPQQASASTGGHGRSVNLSEGHEQILDASDMGSLRRGRAVLFASGVRPTLIEPEPWFRTKWKDAVTASIAAHDPGRAAGDAGDPHV